MPQQFLGCRRIHIHHARPTRERVTEIMECKVPNAYLVHRVFKHGPKGAVWVIISMTEYLTPSAACNLPDFSSMVKESFI